jgi:hypothetical protein
MLERPRAGACSGRNEKRGGGMVEQARREALSKHRCCGLRVAVLE